MKATQKAVQLGLAVLMLTLPWGAKAQQPVPVWQYAAKFICGAQSVDGLDVVKGLYATTVNIHNSWHTPVQFFKKAVIALPERTLPRGKISAFKSESLGPDEAIGVDCTDIIRGLFAGVALPTHIEGFVVIEVPFSSTSPSDPLDVVAKYTARHRTGTSTADPNIYDVETLDVERVPAKRVN